MDSVRSSRGARSVPAPAMHSIAKLLLVRQTPRSRAGLGLRAASTAAQGPSTAVAGLDSWTLTLERGIGKAYGAEVELQATGAFRAEVFPDLPIATTWQNLIKTLSSRPAAAGIADPAPSFTHYTTRPGALKVITTAANLRSEYDIEMRVVAAAGDGTEAIGGQRANALLCVSGSHPVRTLPLVSRFLRTSMDTLRIAQRLKDRGYIPPSTQLWVVANPNTERDAGLLEAKAALGATAVLTQPPLDWPAYLAWLDRAEQAGLLRPALPPATPSPATHSSMSSEGTNSTPNKSSSSCGASGGGQGGPMRLLVGHPVVSSLANLSFWVSLSGCGGATAAQRLVSEAARAEMEGKEAAAGHFESYNRQLVAQVLARGGVAGLHVMPITKASKRLVLGMLGDGALPPSV